MFIGHAAFRANLKGLLNTWYGEFYEVAGTASSDLSSGDLAVKRDEIFQLLLEFGFIVGPSVLVGPFCRWVTSSWGLLWRMSLVNAYLTHWDITSSPIEGAAQRVHEDTRRFEVESHFPTQYPRIPRVYIIALTRAPAPSGRHCRLHLSVFRRTVHTGRLCTHSRTTGVQRSATRH